MATATRGGRRSPWCPTASASTAPSIADQRRISSSSATSRRHHTCSRISRKVVGCLRRGGHAAGERRVEVVVAADQPGGHVRHRGHALIPRISLPHERSRRRRRPRGASVSTSTPTSWIDVVRGFLPARRGDGAARRADRRPRRGSRGEVFRYEKYIDEPRLGAWQRGAGRHPALVEAQQWLSRRYRVMFDGLALRLVPQRARQRRHSTATGR